MILLVNSNESENKLDYVLKHMGSEEYLEYRERDGLTIDEAYQYLKRCEEQHLDWRTGRPISEDVSNNRNAVYALLDKTEKKINGERKQVVSNTSQNYLTILRNDERFQNIKFNTLRGLPEKIVDGKTRQWTDADDAAARTYIESCYSISNRQKYEDAFTEFQHEREYDPVQTLINGIEWDGTPRVETMLIRWLGAEDTQYNRECSRLLFAGGINRAFRPGCKNDNVIVLVGAQGGGKSTFTQWLALAPELYSSTKTINGQKGLEAISGKWICELEELLATLANDYSGTKSEENAKAFLSTSSDFYRKPYDRRPTDSPRHCIFVGTTNRDEFLSDPTGNRRWFPVRVNITGRWLFDHEQECKAEILQCWAEMKHAFDNGSAFARTVENVELLTTIKEEQEAAQQDDWRQGMIEEYLKDKKRTCLIQVWQEALFPDRAPHFPELKRRDANTLTAIICNKMGWVRGNAENFEGYGKQKSYHKEPPKIDFEPF